MVELIIIGNLTADPEKRETQTGKALASFTVAVNEKRGANEQSTFFRCTAWEKTAELILNYLHKGDKAAFRADRISARAYTANGEARASLEITIRDVEFLSTKKAERRDTESGMIQAGDNDLPWEKV